MGVLRRDSRPQRIDGKSAGRNGAHVGRELQGGRIRDLARARCVKIMATRTPVAKRRA